MILDPFDGSGTMARITYQLGRRFIGVEIHSEYAKLVNDRLTAMFHGFDTVSPRKNHGTANWRFHDRSEKEKPARPCSG